MSRFVPRDSSLAETFPLSVLLIQIRVNYSENFVQILPNHLRAMETIRRELFPVGDPRFQC